MTAGDLYPLLEYSITQVSSNGQIHSYFTTREALIEPYLKNLKQRSSWEVLQMKQSFIRFLASQEPCCVWEEENESVYICSAGYKAIILSDKMLLIDSPRPVNRILLEEEVQRCPWFQTSSWLGTIGFYILFLMICLPEYRRQISSCAHIVDAMHSPCKSVYVKAVNHCPLLKLVQKELDMHCIQLSLQTKHNNTSWQIIMDGKQQHCSLFKQLDELRKRVRCYQNGLESQNLVHHHRILCEKTKLIVFSFFFNILLCAILIGSTSANSFVRVE
ncbi:uncharacterized protein Gasu_60590 [Galdieria sulphuraria]|uniref:Uncharacterized protein n=1 Tax=Galdieria sulphuraria TaxID=130081 RepID=M2XRI7_GALSU|nr:uncharacterized protein Gasu_60590 [Galdieria sulphuraria]EME26283.1 hypothetical protein Gasu_60590 [Galdieria sulphuraria]|eukprot:XP_005702803.1 hypothetical protein Gasu_60590 [Galdieria sulphuraria]